MKYLRIFILYGLFAGAAATASAQQMTFDSTMRSPALASFDHPIDAEKYVVRPGERLVVSPVGGGLPPIVLVVDPDGMIIDPRMGVANVAGKTLAEVRQLLVGPLSKQYRAERIVVSVFCGGAPGPCAAVPATAHSTLNNAPRLFQ